MTSEYAHGVDFVGDPSAGRFGRHYVVWPGSTAMSEDIRAKFTRGMLNFFADHPGWNVTVADGQVSMWREDRVIPAAKRPALLERAAEVYRVLAQRRAARSEASNTVETIDARPIDLGNIYKRFFALFFCLATGLLLGAVVGMAICVVVFSFAPQPPVWVVAAAFFLPSLLGMALCGFIVFRAILPRIGNKKYAVVTRHAKQSTNNNEMHIHSEGSP